MNENKLYDVLMLSLKDDCFKKWGITQNEVNKVEILDNVISKKQDEVAGLFDPITKNIKISKKGIFNAVEILQRKIDENEAFYLILAHETAHALDPYINHVSNTHRAVISKSEELSAEIYANFKALELLKRYKSSLLEESKKYNLLNILERFKDDIGKVDIIKEMEKFEQAENIDDLRL